MASKMLMEAPICLIDKDAAGQLWLNPRALEVLGKINNPVVAVAIMGLYRTGKSYLMNKLAGQKKGFSLGSTIQSHTKGIWMWCVPHPRNPDHVLVLLDTEGLGDVEKGNSKHDTLIFALAVLLSSSLIYNSMGTIDQYALDRLQLVSELSNVIKVKSKGDEENDGQFVRYFPNFIWVVRDFTLELKIDGKDITGAQYLEHALTLKKGDSKKAMESNQTQECIRHFFPTRTCFVLGRPVDEDNLNRLESLPESALRPRFIEEVNKLCCYIFETAQVKSVMGGHPITGKMFSSLVQSYVATILSGAVPCMENAVLALAAIENEAGIKEALGHYKTQMQKQVKFPADGLVLSYLHERCMDEALQFFIEHCFKDEEREYYKRLVEEITKAYKDVQLENKNASLETCHTLLQGLSSNLETKLANEVYMKSGGYHMYKRDRDELVERFQTYPNKGVKAQEVLEKFLAGKKMVANAILKADENLKEAAKKLAEEKEKAEQMERKKKVAEEKKEQAEQLLQVQERNHRTRMVKLQAQWAKEAANFKKEVERALESLLREQAEMLLRGFNAKARLMEREIAALRNEISRPKVQEMSILLAGLEFGVNVFSHLLESVED